MRSRIAMGSALLGMSGGAAMAGDAVVYTLADDAMYSWGCFGEPGVEPQCACPVSLTEDFTGTFELSPLPDEDPLLDLFAMSNIDWIAFVGSDLAITGSGTYEVGTGPDGTPVQSMTLELFLDGEGPVLFESGLVEGGDDDFPPDITVLIGDGFGCPGVRIGVAATPVEPPANPADVAPPGGDGAVNVEDLMAVILAWGSAGTPMDIDGSGLVDVGDVLAVVLGWTD